MMLQKICVNEFHTINVKAVIRKDIGRDVIIAVVTVRTVGAEEGDVATAVVFESRTKSHAARHVLPSSFFFFKPFLFV